MAFTVILALSILASPLMHLHVTFPPSSSNINLSSSLGLVDLNKMLPILRRLKGQRELMSCSWLSAFACIFFLPLLFLPPHLCSHLLWRVYTVSCEEMLFEVPFFLISLWTLLLFTVCVVILRLTSEAGAWSNQNQELLPSKHTLLLNGIHM